MSNLTPSFEIFNLTVGNNSFLIEAPSVSKMMVIAKHYNATITTPLESTLPWKSITSYAFVTVDKDTISNQDVIPFKTVAAMIFNKIPDTIAQQIKES